MKRLMATTAIVAALGTTAFAQTENATDIEADGAVKIEQQTEGAMENMEQNAEAAAESVEQHAEGAVEGMEQHADSAMKALTVGENGISAATLLDMTVYTPAQDAGNVTTSDITDVPDNWEQAGEIYDIRLNPDGSIKNVILESGGILDIGDEQIQVSMDDLRFVPDSDDDGEFFVVYTGDPAVLGESETWDQAAEDDSMSARKNRMDQAMTRSATWGEAPAVEREGYETVEFKALSAEDLEGVPVYDANDEWVGEVDDLALGENSTISHAIVDVGGFLGIGETPVAIPFENITFTSAEGELRGYVDVTEETLESMESYKGE